MNAPVPDTLLIAAAERFRLLGDPVRLRLLNTLLEMGEATVQQLADASSQSQQNTSKHLRKLAEGGILSSRKAGLHVHYHVDDPSIPGLCLLVCGQISKQQSEAAAE